MAKPPTPVVPPVPPVVEDKADNEMAEPAINMGIAHVLKYLAGQPSIAALIRGLSPLAKMGILASPVAIAKILQNKEIKFLNPEWADTFKRIIVGGFEEVAEIVTAKGSATNEEIKQAFVKAEAAVMDTMLVLDPLHHVHMPTCFAVQVFRKPTHQNPQSPRGPNQPPPPPAPQLPEIKLRDAMSQGLKASPCCINLVQEAIGKASAAPKSEKKNRSPMEVIGSLRDEELKKKLRLMLNGLTAEDRTRTLEAFRELDSDEELLAVLFMADGNPALLIELLPLLENRDATYAVRKYLGFVGGILKDGWTKAADSYMAWNAGLAPEVERLKRKYHDPDGNSIPYQAPSFWKSVKKLLAFDLL